MVGITTVIIRQWIKPCSLRRLTCLLRYDLGSLYELNDGALGPKQPLSRLGSGCEVVAKVEAGLVNTVLSLSTILWQVALQGVSRSLAISHKAQYFNVVVYYTENFL